MESSKQSFNKVTDNLGFGNGAEIKRGALSCLRSLKPVKWLDKQSEIETWSPNCIGSAACIRFSWNKGTLMGNLIILMGDVCMRRLVFTSSCFCFFNRNGFSLLLQAALNVCCWCFSNEMINSLLITRTGDLSDNRKGLEIHQKNLLRIFASFKAS